MCRETRNAYRIVVGKSEGKGHLKELDVDGRVVLIWISGEKCGRVWTGFIWLRIGICVRALKTVINNQVP
jgi:hypothetical protein